VAHTAQLSISLGVVARRDDVEMRRRRGCFTRARLPMRIVHDFCGGMSDVILQSCGADRTRGRHHSRGLAAHAVIFLKDDTDVAVEKSLMKLRTTHGINQFSSLNRCPHVHGQPPNRCIPPLGHCPLILIQGFTHSITAASITARRCPHCH
jgi:hypothetical protein